MHYGVPNIPRSTIVADKIDPVIVFAQVTQHAWTPCFTTPSRAAPHSKHPRDCNQHEGTTTPPACLIVWTDSQVSAVSYVFRRPIKQLLRRTFLRPFRADATVVIMVQACVQVTTGLSHTFTHVSYCVHLSGVLISPLLKFTHGPVSQGEDAAYLSRACRSVGTLVSDSINPLRITPQGVSAIQSRKGATMLAPAVRYAAGIIRNFTRSEGFMQGRCEVDAFQYPTEMEEVMSPR